MTRREEVRHAEPHLQIDAARSLYKYSYYRD